MCSYRPRILTALFGIFLILSPVRYTLAQSSPDQKAQPVDQGQKPGELGKEEKKKVDEFAEAERLLGGPPAVAECVWLGQRAVNLLWRDDLDTAFRHLDLYDRFGCPGVHIQAAFRCVIRQGTIDPKSPESLNARVHACWINPNLPPAAAAAPASPPPAGTSSQ